MLGPDGRAVKYIIAVRLFLTVFKYPWRGQWAIEFSTRPPDIDGRKAPENTVAHCIWPWNGTLRGLRHIRRFRTGHGWGVNDNDLQKLDSVRRGVA